MSKNKIPEKIIKVLKDDHRSYVYVCELEPYGNKKFVYKEAKEIVGDKAKPVINV